MNEDSERAQMMTRAEEFTEQYENLRTQIRTGTCRWDATSGLGTLLRLGMRAWMDKCLEPHSASEASPAETSSSRIEPIHAQLGALIADMIIPSLQETIS